LFWLYFPRASIVRRISSSAFEATSRKENQPMKFQPEARGRTFLAVTAIALLVIGQFVWAQNLGSAPASNVAVQGQTGAQPEGAFLNFINWIGNVIAPVGAGGAVVGAVVCWLTGRGFGRWLFAAAALLAISGVTRLIEFWITNGTSGVT
jgi:phosphatidylglycerophosphate synthase